MDLPPELVDSIIDLCHDDKKTLGQCGLVCRAWLPRTRHNLFRSIHLYPSNVSAFLDILTAPHAPHSLIASVREVFATLHSFALAAPEHVCALDKAISLVVAAGIQMLSLDMGHLFKPCMAGFSSWCGNSSRNEISNLDIVHTTFDSSFKFTTWLSTWSALKSLTLKQVRIRDLHPPQCHPKLPSITTLSLDNVKSTSNLGGSLSFLLEELAPSLEHLHLRGCVVPMDPVFLPLLTSLTLDNCRYSGVSTESTLLMLLRAIQAPELRTLKLLLPDSFLNSPPQIVHEVYTSIALFPKLLNLEVHITPPDSSSIVRRSLEEVEEVFAAFKKRRILRLADCYHSDH